MRNRRETLLLTLGWIVGQLWAQADGDLPVAVAVGLTWTSPTGLRLVAVPAGDFLMGSASAGSESERPVRPVSLGAFWMAATEITQTQYRAVLDRNPSYFSAGAAAAERPVEQVSWYDALVFCNRLSLREGLTPVYRINRLHDPNRWGAVPTAGPDAAWDSVTINNAADGYRLPTEAEWEYAARGGPVSRDCLLAGADQPEAVAWFDRNAYALGADQPDWGTHPVAGKAANELGLYDLSGNVMEWCHDWSGPYGDQPQANPTGPANGEGRIIRGGSWDRPDAYLRSTARVRFLPWRRYLTIGFRVVRRSP